MIYLANIVAFIYDVKFGRGLQTVLLSNFKQLGYLCQVGTGFGYEHMRSMVKQIE